MILFLTFLSLSGELASCRKIPRGAAVKTAFKVFREPKNQGVLNNCWAVAISQLVEHEAAKNLGRVVDLNEEYLFLNELS